MLFALAFAAVVSALVYAGRCVALFGDLRLFSTTGEEGVVINGVWKAAHNFPVYQLPDRDPYVLSLYNYVFFYTYGWLSAWCGMDGDRLVTFCRLLTFVSAALGVFSQWRILCMALGKVSQRESAIIALLSFLTWYGTFYMNWWLVSVRPDVPAVAFAMAGLAIFLSTLRSGARWWPIVFAVVAFYAAWSFKQSVVWILAGAVAGAFTIANCRRQALLLALPLAGAFALTLALGTEAYRYQLITAPAMSRIILGDSLDRFFSLVPPLAFFWFFAALPAVVRLIPALRGGAALLPSLHEHGAIIRRILLVTAIIAVPIGFVAIGKEGSGRNHLMEAVVIISTLATIHVVQCMRSAQSGLQTKILWVAALLAVTLCLRPLNSAFSPQWTGIRVGNNADVIEHQQLAALMRDLPKPVYMTDEIQAQTWHSTDGSEPAIINDSVYYFAAKRTGKLINGGLSSLFTQRRFAAILIAKGDIFYDEVVPAALAAGYRESSGLPEFLRHAGNQLLIRADLDVNSPPVR